MRSRSLSIAFLSTLPAGVSLILACVSPATHRLNREGSDQMNFLATTVCQQMVKLLLIGSMRTFDLTVQFSMAINLTAPSRPLSTNATRSAKFRTPFATWNESTRAGRSSSRSDISFAPGYELSIRRYRWWRSSLTLPTSHGITELDSMSSKASGLPGRVARKMVLR